MENSIFTTSIQTALYTSTNTYSQKGERGIFFPFSYGETIGESAPDVFLYVKENHLGNVLSVVSDRKLGVDNNSDNIVDYYLADVVSTTDYYAFGAQMPGRTFVGTTYRYGFNGKEKDDEVHGSSGTSYDYGFRIYDPRLGRFLSVDPLTKSYPWYTPYQFAGNKPIWAFDLDGLEEAYYYFTFDKQGTPMLDKTNSKVVADGPKTSHFFIQNANPTAEADKWIEVKNEWVAPGGDKLDFVILYGKNNRDVPNTFDASVKVTVGPQMGLKTGLVDLQGGGNIKVGEVSTNKDSYFILRDSDKEIEFNQFAQVGAATLQVGVFAQEKGDSKGLNSLTVGAQVQGAGVGLKFSNDILSGQSSTELSSNFSASFIVGVEAEITAKPTVGGPSNTQIKDKLKGDISKVPVVQ